MQLIYTTVFFLLNNLVLGANKTLNKNPGSPPRIVGGYEVSPQFRYPFIVDISVGGDHWCGGSLYNDHTVITAAHCSDFNAEEYTVQIHRHNLTKTSQEERGKTFKVKQITIHPNYTQGYQNDIAIWKLDKPYPTKKTLIDLDKTNINEKVGTMLKVVGWGSTEAGGYASPTLQEVKVPIFNLTKCSKGYEAANEVVFKEGQFCAGFPEGGKDACQGDSGGPLFVESYNRVTLVGVVSWGIGCADPNFPGVYTKVNNYLEWIAKNL